MKGAKTMVKNKEEGVALPLLGVTRGLAPSL